MYDLSGGVLKTVDTGATWKSMPTLTTNDFYSVFFTDANTGYVAGVGGTILKTTTGGSVSVENKPPPSWDLAVYPNPASGKIHISSRIKYGEITFSIFNLQGEEVTCGKYKPGNPVETDISTLPMGVYVIRVQSSSFVGVSKIVKQ
jgi:hypothetical protein